MVAGIRLSSAPDRVFSDLRGRPIAGERLALFHDFLGRNQTAAATIAKLKAWLDASTAHKESRRTANRRRAGEIVPGGISFSSGLLSLSVIDLTEDRALRELLEEGFEVHIAHPADDNKFGRPFFVWRRETDGRAMVEVFGQPYLYSDAETMEVANRRLSSLMELYHSDLKNTPDLELSKSLLQMKQFLAEVFND